MTMMSDLPHDLLEEILSRVPLTCLRAVRSTCKTWNNLSNKSKFYVTVCSLRIFNFQGILQGEEFVDSSIKPVCNLIYQVKISKIVNCDGLLLCITSVNTEIVVWNPYLGQTRWIKPIKADMTGVKYALGYDDNKNRNHKILRTWRVINGKYLLRYHREKKWEWPKVSEDFLLCFDFTRERFGPHLPLPFYYDVSHDFVGLSSVREEQLAVLFEYFNTSEIEIWTTTEIEPNVVSWIPFLKVDNTDLKLEIDVGSFYIDQEKKLAVVFESREFESRKNKAYIFGENGYMKKWISEKL
ncbi:hypothetical protein ARALYDRAFT_898340 [Arabidopsis lyrata subsp. lyrata]|uniref:F-box domain-containing protein n=1 Tax=Arabidopsis lyrata subsp. lyrata TaxID=81972 RepID=D7LA08_ARALL|nr:hypothetical protein ARALYDRAFT_898340 [Arabidopsis lyrata subsp. lyrata]